MEEPMKVICPTCEAALDLDPTLVAIFTSAPADVTVRCPTCRSEIPLSTDPDLVTMLDLADRWIPDSVH
jgi:hypothetical protein